MNKKSITILAVTIITLFTVIAISGAYLRPDTTLYANKQKVEIARLKPFTKIAFFENKIQDTIADWKWHQALLLGGMETNKTLIPTTYHHVKGDSIYNTFVHPEHKDSIMQIIPISQLVMDEHLPKVKTTWFFLGTDKFGRDLLSRLMAGSCISLSVGLIAVIISLIIGITLGMFAGYFGGWLDKFIMWFVNVVWSIPTLLMVIAVTLALGKGFVQVFIAVGLTMWVEVARVVRGEALRIKERSFIKSTLTLGFSHFRIMFKHILPNVWAPVIVISAANFATAILMEAGLSFLGVGTQVPMPSWGGIIRDHYALLTTTSSFLAIAPGICIVLLVFAFMMIGNWLRDKLDVKSV